MFFMNLHHVIFEALYEIKLTRRNLLFNMFVFFALLTTISFTFISFSESDKIEFGEFYLPWVVQALPSCFGLFTPAHDCLLFQFRSTVDGLFYGI